MTDSHQLKFSINIPVSSIYRVLKWAVVLNFLFLFGTWLHHSRIIMPHKYSMQLLLAQFNLAKENVAASWYSSMLLFTIAVMALCCFWTDSQHSQNNRDRIMGFGWLVIAGIFMLLSFDEMGSFHEMIGETSFFKKAGSGKSSGWYAFYALIAAVAVLMITFFLVKFKSNKTAFLLTILGVILFVSNPFQEKFEIHSWRAAADPLTWRRPVFFLLLEEGSEIFASFCFLSAFARYAIASATGTVVSGDKVMSLTSLLPKNFIFYLTGFAFMLGMGMLIIHLNAWNFARDDNGIPHNWPPSVLSFAGFAASLYLYFKFNQFQKKELYLVIAINCLLLSVYFGCNIYGYQSGIFGKLKYAVLALTIITGLAAVIKLNSLYTKFLLSGWVLLMGASVFSHRFYPAAFGYLAAASLVTALFLHYQYLVNKKHTTSAL